MTQPVASGFWDELTQYLRDFHADLSPLTDSREPMLGAGSFWSRAGEGTLRLSAAEYRDYHGLLQRARDALAPHGDMSEAVIDSALQKAIFDVVGLGRYASRRRRGPYRTGRERVQIVHRGSRRRNTNAGWRSRGSPLPPCRPSSALHNSSCLATKTSSVLQSALGTRHTVDQKRKLELIELMGVDLRGRPVAIQRVHARDTKAAVSLATRKLSITLECLNFFADVISYNRHPRGPDGEQGPTVLRIGESGPAIALQMALAADGSFSEKPTSNENRYLFARAGSRSAKSRWRGREARRGAAGS